MRILIISDVPLRDDNSVGNTYSNLFKNFEGVEFANLYCKPGNPDSSIAKEYYQITEKKMLTSLIRKKRKNMKLSQCHGEILSSNEQKFYDKIRILRFQSFFLIRELIWKIGKWRTKELNDFLNEFKPDIIFSFCLDFIYYSDLIDYCRKYSGAKLVLYFCDDIYAYTMKNPLNLIYKYFVRKRIDNLVKNCDLMYGATPQLANEYSVLFYKKVIPLYKICETVSECKSIVNNPIKITYTGNLFYGRWKTLKLIAQAIEEINCDSIKAQLEIYTTGLTTKEMDIALNIKGSSQVLGAIPYDQVKSVLKSSDLVLHAESFEKKEIIKTRLSFSTKIADCMQSGSCLLAVGPEETASINLLKKNKIALVVSDNNKDAVKDMLMNVLKDNDMIKRTASKMNAYALKNHSFNHLKNNLYLPLEKLFQSKK